MKKTMMCADKDCTNWFEQYKSGHIYCSRGCRAKNYQPKIKLLLMRHGTRVKEMLLDGMTNRQIASEIGADESITTRMTTIVIEKMTSKIKPSFIITEDYLMNTTIPPEWRLPPNPQESGPVIGEVTVIDGEIFLRA